MQYEDNEAELIALEYLPPISERLLKILYLLIKRNAPNSEQLTKYDSILYSQLTTHQIPVSKIFKEMFKRSRFIHGDRASILVDSEGGICEAALKKDGNHMLYGTQN